MDSPHNFIADYVSSYQQLLNLVRQQSEEINQAKHAIVSASENGHTTFIVGNGGSAAIASHIATDLIKNAGIRAQAFNDSSLFTCLANDRGHDHWMEEAVKLYGRAGDVLIAISSSGNSANVRNACTAAREINFAHIITLSGFKPDNPLRKLGDTNLYVADEGYNHVENTHQLILTTIVDLIIGKRKYSS